MLHSCWRSYSDPPTPAPRQAPTATRTVQRLGPIASWSMPSLLAPNTPPRSEPPGTPRPCNSMSRAGHSYPYLPRFTQLRRLNELGTIEAYNKGGETHSFTEVAQLGGGCVQVLNSILGLTPVP